MKKTDQVPPADIDVAVRRKRAFAESPEEHSFCGPEEDDGQED